MTYEPANSPRLRELLDILCEGPISAAELTELEGLTLNNPVARSLLLEYLQIDAHLRWEFGAGLNSADSSQDARQASRAVAEEPMGQVASGQWAVASTEVPPPASPLPPSSSPILGFLGNVTVVLNRPVVWSILGVAVVFYGTFVLFSWNLHPDRLPNGTDGNNLAVAKVNHTADAHWSTETVLKTDNALIHRGERLTIDSGLVQLELKSGAALLVEGPARWSIDGENSATLHAGKLVAKVPQKAIGFTLDTPTARIVDLGTEFGIEVSESGATDLQVSKGSVELHPGRQLSTASTQPPIKIFAGEARRVDPDGKNGVSVTKVAATPDRFTRSPAVELATSKQIKVEGAYSTSTHPALNVDDLIRGRGLKGDCHVAHWSGTMWHSEYGEIKGVIVAFDLARPHRLNSMKVWNFNDNPGDGRFAWVGVKQADVYVSTSGKGDPSSQPTEWKLVVKDQPFARATGKNDYATPTVVPLNDVEGRFVAMVIQDSLGRDPRTPPEPDIVGLSEVQFFGSRVETSKPQIRHSEK